MEAEFASLEEKVNQLVQLCSQLRAENRDLRQQVLSQEQENLKLQQKVDGARDRVSALLARLPEESA